MLNGRKKNSKNQSLKKVEKQYGLAFWVKKVLLKLLVLAMTCETGQNQ
jgi:hypothetical protein